MKRNFDIGALVGCGSKIAEKNYEKEYNVVTIYDGIDSETGLSFHPNGLCGSISLNDDSFFGIRCDHAIWVDGECEGVESFLNGYLNECVMVIGNHKGSTYINLVIFER